VQETASEAITKLIYTYAERIDGGDFAGVADVFAHATLTFEGYDDAVRGKEAIAALYARTTRRYEDGTPRTKHVITNIQVEVDDAAGTAVARSYFTVFQATSVFPLQPIVAGRYHDRFILRDGRWRFVERRFRTELVGDVSHHLLGGPAVLAAPDAP